MIYTVTHTEAHETFIYLICRYFHFSFSLPPTQIFITFPAFFGEEEIARELFKHIPAHTKSTLPTKPENALIEDLCYECDLTALHLASYSGSENVVRAILNQPAVDVKSPSSPGGYTALHLACLTGHVGVVGLLLSRSTALLSVCRISWKYHPHSGY